MALPGQLPYRVRGYCGTCGKEFGEAASDRLGFRIKCDDDHLAQVIAEGEIAATWLRVEARLLKWQISSPFAKLWRSWPKLPIGTHFVLSSALIVLVLVLESIGLPAWALWLTRISFGTAVGLRFVDIFLTNTSITFTSRFAVSPLRSVFFSLLSYVQIVACYGYFYCVLADPVLNCIRRKSDQDVPQSVIGVEAVFYSFGTIATVGYGGLEPVNPFGKAVVASELVAGLYFVVIILAQVSAWSSHSKVEEGRISWTELKAENVPGTES